MTKKNLMMRIASVLLIAVVLTTSVIGGTLAKYTTSYTIDSTTAHVAQWGISITAGSDASLFDKTEGDSSFYTVYSDSYVVAPGMAGSIEEITIAGTPEVAYNVKIEGGIDLGDWTVDGSDYCPLEFTIGGTVYTCTGTVAEFETALNNALAFDQNFKAGTPINKAIAVSWSWPFSTSDANDIKDTKLAGRVDAIKFNLEITVTQLDTAP